MTDNNLNESNTAIVSLALIGGVEKTPPDLVSRDSLLNSLQRLLEHYDIIFLEGERGVGKTTFLLDFVWQNLFNVISHFAINNYKYTYSYDFVLENLYKQIYYFCNNDEINHDVRIDIGLFNSISGSLYKQIKKKKKPLYFVFDGFENLQKNQIECLITIFDNLPWGKAKFIFTGLKDHLCPLFGIRNIKTKDFLVPYFGIADTRQYFSNECTDEKMIQELHKLSDKGHPEKLKELKLLCVESGSVESLLNSDIITSKSNFLDILWEKVNENDELQKEIIALVAFNDVQLDLATICTILKIDNDSLINKIQDLHFLEIVNGSIIFHIETFRKYAKNKLLHLEDKVNSCLIEYYEINGKDENSVFNLPSLYKKAKKMEKLTKFYSIDAFIHIVTKYQSMGSVKQHFSQGFDASKLNVNNKFEEAYLRFALHKSSINDLEKHELWESEIEARIALGDYEQAFVLANSAFLKEDRLKLLTILAKEIRIRCLPGYPDTEKDLVDQIKNLYEQIDFSTIPEKGFEIASLLLYSCYELAIKLVETISNNNATEGSLDYAFAYLLLHATEANRKSKKQLVNSDLINEKIKDKEIKEFTKAFNFLSCEYDVEQIIGKVERLSNFHQRMFLIINWISNNIETFGVEKAIKYALEEIVKASKENVPNATTLSEIACPLPSVKNSKEIEDIVLLFDAHRNTINTPTKSYVKLQLIIADALNTFNRERAKDRIYDIFLLIDDLSDLSVQTDCLCLLWVWLIRNDDNQEIEESICSSQTIEERIRKNVYSLLDSTAYHYKMIEFIIETLVSYNTDFIFEIIKKVNTGLRRDWSYGCAIIKYLQKNDLANIDLKLIEKYFNEIVDINKKEEIIIEVIDKYYAQKDKVIGLTSNLLPYIDIIESIKNLESKCYVITRAINIFNFESGKYRDKINILLVKLNTSWENIDCQWTKIKIGFNIVRDLVDYSKEEANKYLKLSTSLKQQEPFSSESIVETYINSIKLCVRAFAGLSLFREDVTEEKDKLAEVINKINSDSVKIKLWSEVALRLHINKKYDLFHTVYKEHISTLLVDWKYIDYSCYYDTIIHIAPVLYLYNQHLFSTDYLKKLPTQLQNVAIANVCDFILTKIYIDDPCDEDQNILELDYSEMNDVCFLIERLFDDFMIYHFIDKAVKALMKSKKSLSGEQKESIRVKIDSIIDSKFPTADGVKHDGYKIVAKAALLSTEVGKIKEWNLLIEAARGIDNHSDKALILIIIAKYINIKSGTLKIELLEEAFSLTQSIPSIYEKAIRFSDTCETWLNIDTGKFTRFIKLAYQDLLKNKDGGIGGLRDLIDAAQQHDPKLAESLVTMLDQDDARKSLKDSLKKRIESNSLIKTGCNDYNKLIGLSAYQFNRVFYNNLKDLLNRKLVTKDIKDTFDVIEKSSTLTLSDAIYGYQYFIQNACMRYEIINKDQDILYSIYSATIENTKLIAILSMDNINKMKTLYSVEKKSSSSNILVLSGEKVKAIDYIRKWIIESVDNKMFIIDPYFDEEDMVLLKIIQELKPSCHVTILTGKKNHINSHYDENDKTKSINREIYKKEWNKISSEPPIDTTIKIVWDRETFNCPFHDRWYIAGEAESGLAIGTSFNGLGDRDTQIIRMDKEGLEDVKLLIETYIYKSEKRVNKYNLRYEQFELED